VGVCVGGGAQFVQVTVDMRKADIYVQSFEHVRPLPAKMCSGSEAGSYLRLIDLCITQL